MAFVSVPAKNLRLREFKEISRYLAGIGIDYERWEPQHLAGQGTAAEEILAAYSEEIESLKERGGYVVADVVEINRQTPGLEAMLTKFKREHWHDEDEVRFVIHGHGVFHIRPRHGMVTAIEVEAGDLIRVPRGTLHWFNLCSDMEIKAIRLFQEPTGWTPHYTESGVDKEYQPGCMGLSYISLQT